jgi:hypothetical protein
MYSVYGVVTTQQLFFLVIHLCFDTRNTGGKTSTKFVRSQVRVFLDLYFE